MLYMVAAGQSQTQTLFLEFHCEKRRTLPEVPSLRIPNIYNCILIQELREQVYFIFRIRLKVSTN